MSEPDPPVAPPPTGVQPARLWRHSILVDAPSFADDGWSHPTHTTDPIVEEWGHFRIVTGHYNSSGDWVALDLTYARGAPTELVRYTHANPFGHEIAVLHFPQFTPYERPGVGALDWMIDGAIIRITHILPSGTTDPDWVWIGFAHNPNPIFAESGFGFDLEIKGFLLQADDDVRKPMPYSVGAAEVEVGTLMAEAMSAVTTRHYPIGVPVATPNITSRKRGSLSQTTADFVRELMADAWTDDGRQWTVMTQNANVQDWEIRLPSDPTTPDYTISLGQPGCDFSGLHEERDSEANWILGEWIDPHGGRHQKLKYPRLLPLGVDTTFPLSPGAHFSPGGGTGGFQTFSDWMRVNGFPGFDSGDTYLSSDADDVRAVQRQMGIGADGLVDANTWGTAFNTGGSSGDLGKAIYLPVAHDIRVEPWLYAPDGSKIGANPAWNPHMRRKERYVNFGEGLTYKQVRASGVQLVKQASGVSLVGEIVCTTDPEEQSWLSAYAGTTLRVRYLYGSGTTGIMFHVASIDRERTGEGYRTTLHVDTKWRDALTVAQIVERNREANKDPVRALRRRGSSSLSQDTKVQFDADDVGRIYPHAVSAGEWRVVEFPAASWGTFVRVVATTLPFSEFALGLFTKEPSLSALDTHVGNPLATGNKRPWTPDADVLADMGLIQAWGSAAQPCGYSKVGAADGYKDPGNGEPPDPLTGRLEYDSNIDFVPDNGASLFLAEWCTTATVMSVRLYLQPVEF